MQDKRRHPRIPIKCSIRISHQSIGERVLKTRDISDGGVFLVTEHFQTLSIGSVVEGQALGMMDDAPILRMEVVRLAPDGMGLKYLDA